MLRARRRATEPRLSTAVARAPIREAGSQDDAADEDRTVDGCAGASTARRSAPVRAEAARLSRADETEEHLCGRASAARRSRGRAASHHVRPDRRGDRTLIEHEPESDEHP